MVILMISNWYYWDIIAYQHETGEKLQSQRSDAIPMSPINHYGDVIMGAIVSQITSLTILYSTVYADADQRKHQSSASLAFVWGIHRGPVNSPHKWPVTRKMFPFDDVIMCDILFMRWITDKYTFRQQHTSKNRPQCNVAKLILISNSEKLIIKWLWIIIFICMLKTIMTYKEGNSVRGFKPFYL